jgi:hypothetical protein
MARRDAVVLKYYTGVFKQKLRKPRLEGIGVTWREGVANAPPIFF